MIVVKLVERPRMSDQLKEGPLQKTVDLMNSRGNVDRSDPHTASLDREPSMTPRTIAGRVETRCLPLSVGFPRRSFS